MQEDSTPVSAALVRCRDCGLSKPPELFARINTRPDKLGTGWCRRCRNAYTHRHDNPEALRRRLRRWNEAHPTDQRERNRRSKAKHREKVLAANAAYREARRDELRAKGRAYLKEHADEAKARTRNYRARKKNATGTHTATDIR